MVRFLYMVLVCMDANFRLKNRLISNFSVDPGLSNGMAYMTPRSPYESYVLSQADAKDVRRFILSCFPPTLTIKFKYLTD